MAQPGDDLNRPADSGVGFTWGAPVSYFTSLTTSVYDMG